MIFFSSSLEAWEEGGVSVYVVVKCELVRGGLTIVAVLEKDLTLGGWDDGVVFVGRDDCVVKGVVGEVVDDNSRLRALARIGVTSLMLSKTEAVTRNGGDAQIRFRYERWLRFTLSDIECSV